MPPEQVRESFGRRHCSLPLQQLSHFAGELFDSSGRLEYAEKRSMLAQLTNGMRNAAGSE
jgi:hypothetical protein